MGFVVDFIGDVVGGIVDVVSDVVGGVVGFVSKVVGGIFGFLIGGGKKSPEAKSPNNLTKNLDPEASRKIILGKTAAPLDIRYWEVWGSEGQKFDEVLALATHKVNSIGDLYIEDDLAITAAGVVSSKFTGVLSRVTKDGSVGQAGVAVGGGTQWTAVDCPFTGCAYEVLKWSPSEEKLPNGIPSRYTQVVEGAPVYDPRRDSTVPGGTGTHRINDQTTWEYATLDGNSQPIGRNNALQALWYLIGWKINDKLVAGRGILPEDINLATFITGANNCEAAAYYTDIILATDEDHTANENAITANGLIGRLIDPGGLWSYYANVDDTANIAADLTDADILQGANITWDEYRGMSDQFNQVVGKYVMPTLPVLYQPYSYPMVRDATYENNLGIKKRKTLDFRQVLDGVLAQRLARLYLNQGQYQGEFQANFNYKALRGQAYSVVRYTSERFGWTKLFRVWRQDISAMGGVGLLLKEIHASIWSAGTVTTPEAPGAGLRFDPRTEFVIAGLTVAQKAFIAPDGTKGDGFTLSWTTPHVGVRRTETRYRLNGTTDWVSGPTIQRVGGQTSVAVGPLFSGAIYDIQARHISTYEIPGPWTTASNSPFAMGTTGNVNLPAINAAGGTANWSQVVDNDGNRPDNNADVTGANTAAAITGQGALATLGSIDFESIYLTGIGKPASYAGSNFSLVAGNNGSVSIAGNRVVPSATSANLNFAYTRERLFNGAAASGRMTVQSSSQGGFGFSDELTPTSTGGWTPIKYGFVCGSSVFVWSNGATLLNLGAGVLTDSYSVTYDDMTLRWWKNGAEVHALAVGPGMGLRLVAGGLETGHGFQDLTFAPFNRVADINGVNLFDSGGATPLVSLPRGEVRTPLGTAAAITGQGALATRGDVDLNQNHITEGPLTLLSSHIRNSFLENGVLTVRRPIGGTHNNSNSSVTGAIKVTLPVAGLASMLRFRVNIYNYTGNTNSQYTSLSIYEVSGYAYGTNLWANVAAQYIGSERQSRPVRFGYDAAGKACIWIGETTTIWSYPKVEVTDLMVSHSNMTIDNYEDGWSVSIVTVFDTVNISIAKPRAGDAVFGEGIYEAGTVGGGVVATKAAFRTAEGTAAAFASQGWFATQNALSLEDTTRLTNRTRIGLLSSATGRIIDPVAYNTQFILGPRSTTSLTPTYTVNATDVTVSIPAHTRRIAGISGPVALSYGAGSFNVPFDTYWMAYIDDAALAGNASPTYNYTTVSNDLLAMNRYHVASGTSPSSAGTGGTTTPTGSAECVAFDSYLPDGRQAFEIEAGDELLVLDYCNTDNTTFSQVTNNQPGEVPCVEIETVSGIKLIASTSTPITLRNLDIINILDCLGHDLPVQDTNGFRWEICISTKLVGPKKVAHISANHCTYAAGMEQGRYIFTHNAALKP